MERLFSILSSHCDRVSGFANLQYEAPVVQLNSSRMKYLLTTDTAAMTLVWEQLYDSSTEYAGLEILEFDTPVRLSSKMLDTSYSARRGPIKKIFYQLELSRSRELGWSTNNEEFISSEMLADRIFTQFLEGVNEHAEKWPR